jgi:amino acid transporter
MQVLIYIYIICIYIYYIMVIHGGPRCMISEEWTKRQIWIVYGSDQKIVNILVGSYILCPTQFLSPFHVPAYVAQHTQVHGISRPFKPWTSEELETWSRVMSLVVTIGGSIGSSHFHPFNPVSASTFGVWERPSHRPSGSISCTTFFRENNGWGLQDFWQPGMLESTQPVSLAKNV